MNQEDDQQSTEEEEIAGGDGDGDGGKAGDLVGTEVETDQSRAQNLRVCDICGKTFTSGNALGGHKRSHSLALKKNAKNSTAADHHKGILPPPPPPATLDPSQPQEKGSPSSSTSSGHGEYDKEMDGDINKTMNPVASSNIPGADEPVDLLKDLSQGMLRWGVTAKRGSRGIGAVAAANDKEMDGGINKTMNPVASSNIPGDEPVDLLKDLSQGMLRWGVTAKRGGRSIGAVAAANCLVRLSQYKNLQKDEAADSNHPNVHNLDNPHDHDEHEDTTVENSPDHWLKKESNENQEDDERTESDEIPDIYKKKKNTKSHNITDSHRYKCVSCNKTFSTYQALGRHRSIHGKCKISTITSMDGSETTESDSSEISKPMTEEAHHSSDDHASLLSEGRRLSGQGQQCVAGEATDKSGGKALDFDLNLPCKPEEEDP